jgi:hypothetical protein
VQTGESALHLLPALRLHDAAQLATAMAVAAPMLPLGRPLPLLSAPDATGWASPDLFLAMVALGMTGCDIPHLPVLDCGDAAGHALGALRAGCPAVVLAHCPAFPMVAGAAAELGLQLWPAAPPALELLGWAPESAYGTARLRAWLAGDTARGLG